MATSDKRNLKRSFLSLPPSAQLQGNSLECSAITHTWSIEAGRGMSPALMQGEQRTGLAPSPFQSSSRVARSPAAGLLCFDTPLLNAPGCPSLNQSLWGHSLLPFSSLPATSMSKHQELPQSCLSCTSAPLLGSLVNKTEFRRAKGRELQRQRALCSVCLCSLLTWLRRNSASSAVLGKELNACQQHSLESESTW